LNNNEKRFDLLGILPCTRQRLYQPRKDMSFWKRNVMRSKQNSEQLWLHFWRTKWKWMRKCKRLLSNSLMLTGLQDNSSKRSAEQNKIWSMCCEKIIIEIVFDLQHKCQRIRQACIHQNRYVNWKHCWCHVT